MKWEEFRRAVYSERNRKVSVPKVVGRDGSGRPPIVPNVPLSVLFARLRFSGESDVLEYGHVLGGGASEATIRANEQRLGVDRLPADLRALLAEVDGIHLWADMETGRGDMGIAPIAEWRTAMDMLGDDPDWDQIVRRSVCVSYNTNGDYWLVIDPQTGCYSAMDIDDPASADRVGCGIEALLDWVWRNRVAP